MMVHELNIREEHDSLSEPENSKEGYHTFGGVGSFEVFYVDDNDPAYDNGEIEKIGWYWWACSPGCMPDGEPVGPFSTSIEAYNDAQESDHG
jgi:hypothetical protein